MLHIIVRSLVVSILLLVCCHRARAHDTYVVQQGPSAPATYGRPYREPYEQPYVQPYGQPYGHGYPRDRTRTSIFRFGYRGMFAGALAGLGASYFAVRGGGEAVEAVGISTGIGALSGAALGVSLGIFDRLGMQSAYYISRDMSYGVGFGALVGAIGGGVIALSGYDAEAVLIGLAGGSLAGLALGIITGAIEGQVREPRYDPYAARRVSLSIARVGTESDGWGARLAGRF